MTTPIGVDQPMPPTPSLDTSAVGGLTPLEAARRALGAADAQFVDRRVYAMHPMAPAGRAAVSFYLGPRALHPGLCSDRILLVELKTEAAGDRGQRFVATSAVWTTRFNVVRPEDLRLASDRESIRRTQAACDALQPADAFVHDVSGEQGFDAPSDEAAASDAVLFHTIVRAARGGDWMPFRLGCSSFDARQCRGARGRLARLSVADLTSTGPCINQVVAGNCRAMLVRGHPLDRRRYPDAEWRVQIVTDPGSRRGPTHVSLEFWVPPVI